MSGCLRDKKGNFHNGNNFLGLPSFYQENHHIHDGGYGAANHPYGRKGNLHSGNTSGTKFNQQECQIYDGGYGAAEEMEFRHQKDFRGVKHTRTYSDSISGIGLGPQKQPRFT